MATSASRTKGARGGIDLGGTKIQAVVVDGRNRVLGENRTATPTTGGPKDVADAMTEALLASCASAGVPAKELKGVGVGSPGSSDGATGVVSSARNLPGWEGSYPLGDRLAGGDRRPGEGGQRRPGRDRRRVQPRRRARLRLGARRLLGHRRRWRHRPRQEAVGRPRAPPARSATSSSSAAGAAAPAAARAAWRPMPAARRWRPAPASSSTRAGRPSSSRSWRSAATTG